MKNLLLTLLLFAAALASPAQQTTPVTTLATLNDLLAKVPRSGETIAVRTGYNGQDWGGERVFTHFPTNIAALTTNVAHIFNVVTNVYNVSGQWRSADRANAVQDIRWWIYSTNISLALNAAATYITNTLTQGTIIFPHATYAFTEAITLPAGVDLLGADTTLDFSAWTPASVGDPAISISGSAALATTLDAQNSEGATSLTLLTNVTAVAGGIIYVANTNDYSAGISAALHAGELNTFATSGSISNIQLVEPTTYAYPTGALFYAVAPVAPQIANFNFTLPTTGGGIKVSYGAKAKLDNLSFTSGGTKFVQLNFCKDVDVARLIVDSPTGTNALVVTDSKNVNVRASNLRTADTALRVSGTTIPNTGFTLAQSILASYSSNVFGVVFSGGTFGANVLDCTLYSGIDLGGGRTQIRNSRIYNPQNLPALQATNMTYFDYTLQNNQIFVAPTTASSNTCWAGLFEITSGSDAAIATNLWAGVYSAGSSQRMRLLNNTITLAAPLPADNTLFTIVESDALAANANLTYTVFGGISASGNVVDYVSAPAAEVSNFSLIQSKYNVGFANIVLSANTVNYASWRLLLNQGNVAINNNTFNGTTDPNGGVYAYTVSTYPYRNPVTLSMLNNTFNAPYGTGFTLSNLVSGSLYIGANQVFNFGATTNTTLKVGFRIVNQ